MKQENDVQYWKKQYEKLIDENIKLKEKVMKNTNIQDQQTKDYQIDCLQQENYQLKQHQLKLNKELMKQKQNSDTLQEKFQLVNDENRNQKDEIQKLKELQFNVSQIQKNPTHNQIVNNRDDYDSILQQQSLLTKQSQNINNKQSQNVSHFNNHHNNRILDEVDYQTSIQQLKEKMKIKDSLIEELRMKIQYDEENMLQLKDEYQKRIEDSEKQGRIGQLQTENFNLKQEISRNKDIINNFVQNQSQNSDQSNTYYYQIVKDNQNRIEFINKVCNIMGLTKIQNQKELIYNITDRSEVMYQQEQILNKLANLNFQNKNVQMSVYQDKQKSNEMAQFLYEIQTQLGKVQLEQFQRELSLMNQQKLTNYVTIIDSILNKVDYKLQNESMNTSNILNNMNSTLKNQHFNFSNANNQQNSSQMNHNQNNNSQLNNTQKNIVLIQNIELKKVPQLNIDILSQQKIYLLIIVYNQKTDQIINKHKTQLLKLEKKQNHQFVDEKVQIELNDQINQYLEMEVILFNEEDRQLGNVARSQIAKGIKLYDLELSVQTNYLFGSRITMNIHN